MFPDELSELIENKTQVYCEKCGKPFSLKGVVFKPATIQPPPPKPSREKKEVPKKTTPQGQPQYKFAEKDRDKFDNAIQHLNKYSSNASGGITIFPSFPTRDQPKTFFPPFTICGIFF